MPFLSLQEGRSVFTHENLSQCSLFRTCRGSRREVPKGCSVRCVRFSLGATTSSGDEPGHEFGQETNVSDFGGTESVQVSQVRGDQDQDLIEGLLSRAVQASSSGLEVSSRLLAPSSICATSLAQSLTWATRSWTPAGRMSSSSFWRSSRLGKPNKIPAG